MKRLLLIGTLALACAGCAQTGGDAAKPPLETSGLTVPAGFKVTPFAEGFQKPRMMVVADNGDVLLSDTSAGKVYVLPDRDKNGEADGKELFASGLNQPHGLAVHGGYLYVANTDSVVRFPFKAGDLKATGAAEKLVDLPSGGGHSTRTVEFDPDGKMYVSAGSSCNVCEESDPKRAAIWVYDADGKNGKQYASGLRNAVGIEWFDGQLYSTNNGRDQLGDDIPPEGFYKVNSGDFFGWPYCYTTKAGEPQVWDKDFGKKSPAVCEAAQPSFATTTAHAAPLGLAFYTGQAFPAEYRGKMFVALHGSWNRPQKSGYSVITVDPNTGETKDFMTGFLGALGLSTSGRPADVQVAPDGALFVSDDGNGVMYRVTYQQP